MSKRFVTFLCLFVGASVVCLQAQDEGKFNFNIGGGVNAPLNPTANLAGVSGAYINGAGYNFDKYNAIIGQFSWAGLSPTVDARAQLFNASASSNLYGLTANYRFKEDFTKNFGWYFIAGGGWYYRHSSISHTTELPDQPIPCAPVYYWYGYGCSAGFITRTASTGSSALGGNGGFGFTIRLAESHWRFFIESRYTYAPSAHISTATIPTTFGIMFQ